MRRYEFAVLRYMHDLTARECANVGIVLLDVENRRVHVRVSERHRRVTQFFRSLSGARYLAMIHHVHVALDSLNDRLHDVGEREIPGLVELLAQVLPDPESSFQASPIGFGVAESPMERADELFTELVMRQGPRNAPFPEPESGYSPRPPAQDLRFQPQVYVRRSVRSPLSVGRLGNPV